MLSLLLAAALAAPVPRAALFDEAPSAVLVARAERRPEPVRGIVEYAGALGAMSLVNGVAAILLSESRFRWSQQGGFSVDGSGALVGAGVLVVLSPLAGAVTSWLIGEGSSDWDPSLGWSVLGAYGTSLVAVGAGLGLAALQVDPGVAAAADTALYLTIPLGTVLVQNATKQPRP